MKLRLIFWACLSGLISGLLFWRNSRRYPGKSITWWIAKSVVELVLIMLSAICAPVVLAAWVGAWICRPIKEPWLRVTVGAVSGLFLGLISLYAMEFLILVGSLSVDDITGETTGFLSNLDRARKMEERSVTNV